MAHRGMDASGVFIHAVAGVSQVPSALFAVSQSEARAAVTAVVAQRRGEGVDQLVGCVQNGALGAAIPHAR